MPPAPYKKRTHRLVSKLRNFAIRPKLYGMVKQKQDSKILDPALQESLRRFKAEFFRALGHPTRIHIVEVLREGELPVNQILERVKVEAANLSQHLSVLRAKRVVTNRKDGGVVLYALRDPMLIDILGILRQYFQSHLEESLSMLKGL